MLVALTLSLAVYANPVTAIAPYQGAIYVGRADGAVERVNSDLGSRAVLSKPNGTQVSFISVSPYGLAWLSGPGGTIREKDAPGTPAEQVLTIECNGRAIAVKVQPDSPIRRLAWLQNRVALCYDIGESFFDASGHAIRASSFMPADAAEVSAHSSLWVREQDDGTELAVFARPYSVRQDPRNKDAPLVSLFTAYQVGSWQWAELGGFASNAFDAFPDGTLKATPDGRIASDAKFLVLSDRVSLAPDGVVAREPDMLLAEPVSKRDWQSSRLVAAAVPGDSLWFGASADCAWWWNGSALVQQNRQSGQFFAYLPWAGVVDFRPHCFAVDGSGVWVGSNSGLSFLDPSKPDAASGYGGFLRVPFGVAAPSSADAKKLSDAVFAWRFATSDKAGKDGGIMVASIFSIYGLKLPETAAELEHAGSPVTDQIRFGDVILTDKAAAIYLGNGATVEVRGDRVQNGDIWAFPKAIVRRFAP